MEMEMSGSGMLEDPTGKTDDDFRGGYTADREEYSRIKEKMIAI